jgi:Putative beta-barrel porin-2, OmpL-like. bbp2
VYLLRSAQARWQRNINQNNKQHRRNQMKFNKWTLGLAAVGAVSLASAARADEKMSQVQTALSNTTISGYVDTSIQWNPGSGNGYVAPVSFQNAGKADGFNLNVVDLALDKPLDESPWAAGYHVELWMGPDANSLATLSNPFSNPTLYAYGSFPGPQYEGPAGATDLAIRQAYVALRTPLGNSGIDWKLGVFDSPLGYESTSSPNNPFYTRSYGYTIEPTELTGLEAVFKVNDMLSITGGVADSPSPMINQRPFIMYADESQNRAESVKTYFGDIVLTAPDSWGWLSGSTFTAGVLNGWNASQVYYGGTQTSWYLGATIATPVKGLKAGVAFDYLNVGGTDYGVGDYDYYSWAGAVYASYQVNDKLSLNGRYDYWKYGTQAYDSLTMDVQYNLWANVITRLEARWDHAEHGTAFGGGDVYYYGYYSSYDNYGYSDSANRENAFMLALQVIYQF